MNIIKAILRIALRECGIFRRNPIYLLCMVVFPLLITLLFTSMMNEGQPQRMPVGIVDQDATSTTRAMVQRLSTFQTTEVVGHYTTVDEARRAIQRNEIYAFLYLPNGMTEALMSSRQPKVSFYISETTLVSGALLLRDLKMLCMLASASVGQKTMTAKGYPEQAIMAFLQPISIDLHAINNPWLNYNTYLSNMLIPACLLLFVFLITAYSLGTELKFGTAKELLAMSNGHISVALAGKFLPQTLIFLMVMFANNYYEYVVLGFPIHGSVLSLILLDVLAIFASQGFAIFIFGLVPSLRMSMSICSLWGVLSFSLVGTAFPLYAMDRPLQLLAQLFPLRHYYMAFQITVFNGYPLGYAWIYYGALLIFIGLPLFTMPNIRKAMYKYEYIP